MDLDDLWVSREPEPGHDPECPHCRAATAGIDALREATRSLAGDWDEPPSSVFTTIMTAVRAEVRRGRLIQLSPTTMGPIEVYEQAIAAVLHYAVDTTGVAIARRCRITPGTNGSGVRIQVSVTVAYGSTIPEVVTELRDRIKIAATAQIGVSLHAIDIDVEDVHGI